MLNANDILNAQDIKTEKMTIPEWGGDVFIKEMSGLERDSWELYASSELNKKDNANIRAKIASLVLCDQNGKRLFNDSQMIALSQKSGKALDRVYNKALEINKLSDEEIEQLEKN